jgi:hypothetical protein
LSEIDLQRAILTAVNQLPTCAFFRNSIDNRGRYKRGMGEGSADIIGCANGRFIALEVKLPTESLRPSQESWRAVVVMSGGKYFTVRSTKEALACVLPFLR